MFSAFPSSKVQNSDITVDISSSDDDEANDRDKVHKSRVTTPTATDKQTLTLFEQLKTQQSLIESLKKQLDSIRR